MVDSDSIHVCTLKKETTKEENSRLHSQLSLSSSSSLLIKLFYMFGWPQPFQSHMEDKSLWCSKCWGKEWNSNRYLWLLYRLSGKHWKPLRSRTRMTLRTRIWGVSQKTDTVENFIPLFFLTRKVGTVIFIEGVKPSHDRKMKKLLTFDNLFLLLRHLG